MSVPCEMLKDKLTPLMEKLEKLMKGPLAMLRAGERLIEAAKNVSADFWANIMALINLPDASTDMSALRAALVNLRNCLYFAGDSAYLAIIDATIAAIDGGATASELPEDFLNSTKSDVKGRAASLLTTALDNDVLGKLQKIEDTYHDVLVQLGIMDILEQMDSLIDCITSVCGDAQGMDLKVEEYRGKLRIGLDDIAHPDFANSENISAVKRQAITDAKTAIAEAKSAISTASYF